jgi:hypothetical protein
MKFLDAKKLAEHGVIYGYDAVRHFDDWCLVLDFDELKAPVTLLNTHGSVKYYKTLDSLVRDVERISGQDINKLLLK